MPRGNKKNYKPSTESRGARGSKRQRPAGGKQWKRNNRRRFQSPPRELWNVEDDNIAPLCNKACCRPPVIQGLQQLLEEEPQQQLQQAYSYRDTATIPTVQDQYVFEDMHIVQRGTNWRNQEYDAYSEELISFDSQGFAKYQPGSQAAFKRQHPGYCETCDYGAYSSYGFNGDYEDFELKVLPSLEFAVSSRLAYKPFRTQLQNLITDVYDRKDKLYESKLDCSDRNPEGKNFVKELNDECEWKTRRIVYLLKDYVANEVRAQQVLSYLSLGVYKCHLQQLAIERDWGKEDLDMFLAGESGTIYEHVDWKSLQAFFPHNRLSSIGIIVQHVRPFLLDIW